MPIRRYGILGISVGVVATSAAVALTLGPWSSVDFEGEEPAGSSPPVAASPVPLAGAQSPRLLSLVPGADGCRWEIRRPPDADPEVRLITQACPDDVIWVDGDGIGPNVLEYDGRLVRVDEFGREVDMRLPELPRPGAWLVDAWIARSSDLLRVGYIAEIPCAPDGAVCAYDVGERLVFGVRDAEGWERFAMRDGWATADTTGEGWTLPPWGVQGVALAYELVEPDVWRLVSAAPTRSEAGDTPGLDVLDTDPATGTIGLSDLRLAGTCSELLRAAVGCNEHGGPLPDEVVEGMGGEYHEVRSLRFGETDLVFPVVYGDGPHIVAPVLIDCGPQCDPVPLSLPSGSGQLSLWARDGLLLVTRAYAMSQARVFAPGSPDPILTLPPSAVTVWLPQ